MTKASFHRFTDWLKNESYHERGEYCLADACRICGTLRRIRDGVCVGVPCTYQHLYSYESCYTEAGEEVWCGEKDGFRNFCSKHAARVKAFRRNVIQGYGREAGHQIALDASVALATAPYPAGYMTPEKVTREYDEFDRALRQEFLRVIHENTSPPEREGRWCLSHHEYHSSDALACWVQEDVEPR
jgi:hypothetical protein